MFEVDFGEIFVQLSAFIMRKLFFCLLFLVVGVVLFLIYDFVVLVLLANK